jgi:hypothetical protein
MIIVALLSFEAYVNFPVNDRFRVLFLIHSPAVSLYHCRIIVILFLVKSANFYCSLNCVYALRSIKQRTGT